MKSYVIAALLIGASVLAACMSPQRASIAERPAEVDASRGDYRIAPGDVLEVLVFGQDDISGEYTVDSEGRISMPLIDQVSTNGASTSDLERRLVDAYQPDYLRNPDISVKLRSYRPIYVLGEVENAGSYPYQPNMSVLSAIAVAGGYTYRAARNKLFVVRGDDENREERRVLESDTLRPGDTVIIRQRYF